ncbi:4-hydroxy-tetrahydrodipicolinate synthase [bacterium HR17]|uniref:4-hydroxy-tetrahydrodipicolinate synthase n=1 Tax=Candidatus Fervidibacter japonicus TaxID=2035412 RepID=A0A2H5XBU2_9BACT|nr:4-hydroxy-tetrahydrodipicolinate synthase [bacterium HR17]
MTVGKNGQSLGKVITAMVTPFDDDGRINFAEVERLTEHLIQTGSDGIVVAGTTGESPTLSHREKLDLFRVVKQAAAGRAKVIAGTGNYNTAESRELTKEAEQIGVDGVLLVCPYYNRPNQEGLFQHFKSVASATELPVILYNIPSRTGRNIEAGTTLRLANEVPNIVGVKEASGDMKQVADICANAPEGFAVWSGNDEDTFHIVALGGVGVISVVSHICGQECQQMIAAVERGDVAAARQIHFCLMPLIRALFPPTSPNPAPIKAALNLLGFKVGNPRLPLVPCTEAEVAAIRNALQALGRL